MSLEVDGGRIEEDHLELSDKVTPSREECLLDEVLVAPGSKRRLVGRLGARQFVAEPALRPVEVIELIELIELKILESVDLVASLSLIGGAIAAAV